MRQALYIIGSLLLAAVCGAVIMHGKDGEREAQDRIDLLTHHVKSVDSVFRTDTLYFSRVLKVEVAKRDTVLKHLTDTLLVRQFVYAADTAIRACQAVVSTCAQRVAQRDSIIAIYKALKPSRFSLGVIGGCGVGIASKADCIIGIGGSFAVWR